MNDTMVLFLSLFTQGKGLPRFAQNVQRGSPLSKA